jgi:type III restriction enzyme
LKLHFDPNQQFQIDAINSVVEIFEGQPLNGGEFDFLFTDPLFQEGGIGNRLKISENKILENVKTSQKKNELAVSDKLDGMNFPVEMETGTGKTYVYLRTIYELNKKYGFKIF